MADTGPINSKSGSLKVEEEIREEMDLREEERRASERNEQQNLNQGMAMATHSSAHGGIRWGPSHRLRSNIEQAFPMNKQIEIRAYELYLQRGGKDGHDLEDWLIAEREVKQGHT